MKYKALTRRRASSGRENSTQRCKSGLSNDVFWLILDRKGHRLKMRSKGNGKEGRLLSRTVRNGPSKKKAGRKRSLLPVQKTAWELVAENSHNRGAISRSGADRGTRGVKPNHTRLVRAEGALAGRAYRVWMAFDFKAVIHAAYWESRGRRKRVAALCSTAQNGVD